MTDIYVEYTLESFRVRDLHPRSQERPSESGRVPFFFNYVITFPMFHSEKGGLNCFIYFFTWPF